MAEGKVDLLEGLAPSKPMDEAWTGKGGLSGGNDEERGLVGFLDESKDQVTSENSIPLSPQWLYAKPIESKLDARPISSPHGTSLDSAQRDAWRLDGSQDKKEWRRNVPDVESSRRWRDEERETSLLGRRERRKEGDRENEYRKNDRRSDNISARETPDSRTLTSSDRWHEVPTRNLGNENRRDSKWSSRWGPEDKEKESRAEKKMDADKEDSHVEKQAFVGILRPLSESDSRDKWRPRHRQETQSVGSTVYRAAPGFGLDRGRVEGSSMGFTLGRGRSNSTTGLPLSRPSSAGPIGAAAPVNNSESMNGRFGLSADTFRYPRAKLLDIYRKHKMLSSFDTSPEDLEEVPLITQSSSITPLAFVTPDAEEEALVEDIWKGKVTSSEASYNSSRDQNARLNHREIDPYSSFGDSKDKVNMLINGGDMGLISWKVSDNDAYSNTRELGSSLTNSEQKVVEPDVPSNDELVGHSDFLANTKLGGNNSTLSFDVSTKLPDDSNSLFDASFIPEFPSSNEQRQISNSEVTLLEQCPPEELSLYYRDPQGEIQGPFFGVDIISWFDQGFFGTDLPVCLSDAPEGTPFQPLGEVMPHLTVRSASAPAMSSHDRSEPADLAKDNQEDGVSVSDITGSLGTNEHRWTPSELWDAADHLVRPRSAEHQPFVEPLSGRFPLSSSNSVVAIPGNEGESFHDFAGQDAEEVLYKGRPASRIGNSLGKLPSDQNNLSHGSSGHHFMLTEKVEANSSSHNVLRENDLNPLGLLWSELEGTHPKNPLSSNIGNSAEQGQTSLFSHGQEQLNLINDSPFVNDARSSNYRRDTSLNTIHDSIDVGRLSHFEAESNNFSLEEHLLSQQLQKQHLQQQQLLAHQNMDLAGPFMDQRQSSLQHQQSISQPLALMEHLMKIQFEQQRHFKLQQQQQLHHQQQQLHQHQMQVLQQQQQQQQQQQRQQQLLLEQLLHQQLHDPGFGASHVDPRLESDILDQVLLRQQLLNEAQQQSHHLMRHHDAAIEQLIQAKFEHNLYREHHNDLLDTLSHSKHRQMLPLEQQLLLDLQQEHLQAQQFSIASRQHPNMEEERHIGGVWSVDESGQYVRTAASPHQSHPARLNQLDLMQQPQRPSFEQPTHLERNFSLHDHLQRGLYETSRHPLERPIPVPGGAPEHVEFVNALARLQGLDLQEQHGQMGQFPPVVRSHQPHISEQLRIDAMERHWSESDGQQLPNSLIKSRFNQLQMEAEKQRRDLKSNLSAEDPNAWAPLVRNDGSSEHMLGDFLQRELALQSQQSLGLVHGAPNSSYEQRDPSWLFSRPDTDILTAERMGLSDSLAEGSIFAKLGEGKQERLVNLDMEGRHSHFESGGKLAFRSNSGLIEQQHWLSDMDETVNKQLPVSLSGGASLDGIKFSDLKDERGKKRVSKGMGRSESGVELAIGSLRDHEGLKVNAPARHASFGGTGGGVNFYNYELGGGAYGEEMVNDRISGVLSQGCQGAENPILKRVHDPHVMSSQGAVSDVASVPPIKGKSPTNFVSCEEERREAGGNLAVHASEAPTANKKEMRFRRTSSSSDADLSEASFIDMLKSTKKLVPEADASTAATDSSETGPGGKSGKKKGKKGRQIDPSLLGFKVHSNRIMMGEIQRPDD